MVNSNLNLCCQCWSDVPPTPPNWLVNISTNQGTTKYTLYDGTSQQCTKWKFLDTHEYYANKDTTYPVAEIGWGTAIQWQNINVANNAFDQTVFDVPNGCTTGCNKLFQKDIEQEQQGRDEFIPAHWLMLNQDGNLGQYHCGM